MSELDWRAELEKWLEFRGHLDLVPAIDACFEYIDGQAAELVAVRAARDALSKIVEIARYDGLAGCWSPVTAMVVDGIVSEERCHDCPPCSLQAAIFAYDDALATEPRGDAHG